MCFIWSDGRAGQGVWVVGWGLLYCSAVAGLIIVYGRHGLRHPEGKFR